MVPIETVAPAIVCLLFTTVVFIVLYFDMARQLAAALKGWDKAIDCAEHFLERAHNAEEQIETIQNQKILNSIMNLKNNFKDFNIKNLSTCKKYIHGKEVNCLYFRKDFYEHRSDPIYKKTQELLKDNLRNVGITFEPIMVIIPETGKPVVSYTNKFYKKKIQAQLTFEEVKRILDNFFEQDVELKRKCEDSDRILTAKINNKNIRISNFDYEIG